MPARVDQLAGTRRPAPRELPALTGGASEFFIDLPHMKCYFFVKLGVCRYAFCVNEWAGLVLPRAEEQGGALCAGGSCFLSCQFCAPREPTLVVLDVGFVGVVRCIPDQLIHRCRGTSAHSSFPVSRNIIRRRQCAARAERPPIERSLRTPSRTLISNKSCQHTIVGLGWANALTLPKGRYWLVLTGVCGAGLPRRSMRERQTGDHHRTAYPTAPIPVPPLLL
jgi:hypothetical protein